MSVTCAHLTCIVTLRPSCPAFGCALSYWSQMLKCQSSLVLEHIAVGTDNL